MKRASVQRKLAQPARRQLTRAQYPSTDNFQYSGPWYSCLNSRWALESSVDPLPWTGVDPPLPGCSSVGQTIAKEPVEPFIALEGSVQVAVENEPSREKFEEK